MNDYPLNLGMEYGNGMALPQMAKSEPQAYYPGTRIELPEGSELPDEGTITFRYRTTRIEEDKRTEKCVYELDLLELVSAKGAGKSKGDYDNVADGLDKIKAELESE